MVPRTFLNEPIVLFRAADGCPEAVRDGLRAWRPRSRRLARPPAQSVAPRSGLTAGQ